MFEEGLLSNYVLCNEGSQQTFRHQWMIGDEMQECYSCFTSIDVDEPPSQIWIRQQEERPQLDKQQQAILQVIEARQTETFFFCDESGKQRSRYFMLHTCVRAVPKLLYWMFHNGTQQVEFNLACYVNVANQVVIFNSGTLRIEHHYDIDECVAVIHEMISQRIFNYLRSTHNVTLDQCSVTRLRIQVKRLRDDVEAVAQGVGQFPAVPLRLRHDTRGKFNTSEEELAKLHATYAKYERDCNGYFPSNMHVNLYGLQRCETTKEVFIAPYHISETLQQRPNKNFLILNDVTGQFQRLQELPSPLTARDAKPSAELECRRCRAQFQSTSRMHIHKQLRCGRDFSVDSIHPDIVEIYEQCLPIWRNGYQFACYGVTKPKTVIRKSSDQMRQGPCIIISNFQPSSLIKYC